MVCVLIVMSYRTVRFFLLGGVIGCKQFRVVMMFVGGWSWVVGGWLVPRDREAIMAGKEAGVFQSCIAHLIGRSPSAVCREIPRHAGPDGAYRAEEADKAARVAKRRLKERVLDCGEVLRDRVIADLSQGLTPRQISGHLRAEACGSPPTMDTSHRCPGAHDQPRGN